MITLDLETTSVEKYKRKGNPWFNKILVLGFKEDLNNVIVTPWCKETLEPLRNTLDDHQLTIGHNLKYDLLYLWTHLQGWFANGGQVWDTQLAEYILSGQQHRFAALRDIAVNKYNCEEREKHLEKYLASGVGSESVPIEKLMEDCANDVQDTYEILLQQLVIAKSQKQLKLINAQMDALLATTEMEHNGMCIDVEVFKTNKEKLEVQQKQIEDKINRLVLPHFPPGFKFNPKSPTQLSKLFFGGKIKITSGKNRGTVHVLKPMEKKPAWIKESKREGVYSVNEKNLTRLAEKTKSKELKEIITQILNQRAINTQLSSFYNSVYPLIYYKTDNNYIHAQLSQCGYAEDAGGTATGRLSSANPNIQNIPKDFDSPIKEHFISRYKDGVLIEFDYKQLEIIVQAQLSQDKQFMQDVLDGVDFHCKRLAGVENVPYTFVKERVSSGDQAWVDKRTKAKQFSFQRSYGAQAKSISESTGMPVGEVEELIAQEESMYPCVTIFNKSLEATVIGNAIPISIDENNILKQQGWYQSLTGRKYFFTTDKKGEFIYPQIINYMIQGTGTSDIVLIMLGRLWRASLRHEFQWKLINTVHDSVLIDCHPDEVEKAINFIKLQLEDVQAMMKEYFDYRWELPIEVDVKVGKNWKTMEKIK